MEKCPGVYRETRGGGETYNWGGRTNKERGGGGEMHLGKQRNQHKGGRRNEHGGMEKSTNGGWRNALFLQPHAHRDRGSYRAGGPPNNAQKRKGAVEGDLKKMGGIPNFGIIKFRKIGSCKENSIVAEILFVF